MTQDSLIREKIRVRQAEANQASTMFDFVREGSLATFWRQATPGTTYWRGYLPMRHLPGQVIQMRPSRLTVEDTATGIHTRLEGQEGVAIWQFLGDDERARIALQLQRQGTRTLMEVDDLYLRYAPPLYGKYGAWPKTHVEAVRNGTMYSVEMHQKIVPMMDGIIVSTEYLADEYAKWNDNVYVCPNSVDPEDWDVPRAESETLRIGYYGSPSHTRDWPVVKKAMKWAQRQPDVEVVMLGFSPPGWAGKVYPWTDDVYEARKHLGQIDVGISPLKVNPWSSGKSDLKALEYAMAGAMPIIQNATPYDPWLLHGWEWKASSEADWFDIIREVVVNRDLVPALAASAKEYVLAHRTIQDNVHHWRDAVDG